MNGNEGQPESGSGSTEQKAHPVKEFKAMPSAERWLAMFAAAVIVAYFIRGLSGLWGDQVFDVCALIGAVAVLALVVPQLFGVKVLTPRIRMYAFAAGGVLPAAGFVFGMLTSELWLAVMLAGSVAMGLTAWQIAERERLLK